MTAHAVFGVLVVVFSAAAKVSLGHQVIVNRRRRSCAGVSLPFFTVGMLSYDMWVVYGFTGGGWTLVLGQGPGAVLCLVVIWQAFRYRNVKEDHHVCSCR